MGYTRTQRLWRVEVPLAVPLIVAGLRLATVSTIGLVTVSSILGDTLRRPGLLHPRGLPAQLPDRALLRRHPVDPAGDRVRPAAHPGPATSSRPGRQPVTRHRHDLMDIIDQTVAWLTDPAHWSGPNGIPVRMGEHIAISRRVAGHRPGDRPACRAVHRPHRAGTRASRSTRPTCGARCRRWR